MVARPRREGSFVGIHPSAQKTEAVPNSSAGSAGCHANDNRLSPTAVTPRKPLRSAGSATQNDGSTPGGWPHSPGARRGFETSLGPSPRIRRRRRSNGSARPAGRLSGRRCLRTVRCQPDPAGGPIQINGVRDSAAAGPSGVELQVVSPADAVALVAPVRRAAPPAGRWFTRRAAGSVSLASSWFFFAAILSDS